MGAPERQPSEKSALKSETKKFSMLDAGGRNRLLDKNWAKTVRIKIEAFFERHYRGFSGSCYHDAPT